VKVLEVLTNHPIFSWCEHVESGALEQAINLSNHPSIFHHVALMPDCHQGYGMPIGGVIACERDVIPNAVGVDIGCGMCFIETNFSAENLSKGTIREILIAIKRDIPVGHHHRNQPLLWKGFDEAPDIPVIQQELESAKYQLGTLGGGNHFIELQVNESGKVCLMLHSGSRNFGYKIANVYHKKALALCEKYYSNLPNKELAFLPVDSQEGQEYITAMKYALKFAERNRDAMLGISCMLIEYLIDCQFIPDSFVNIHHNYACRENHYNHNVWVHRKGATLARKETRGIIPGSMGTASYIVEGLGNPKSFCSCSHGAGRVMGRADASRTFTKEECDSAMEGIEFFGWGKGKKTEFDFGEAPQAYKNIHEVIAAQDDLVRVVHHMTPIGVVKA